MKQIRGENVRGVIDLHETITYRTFHAAIPDDETIRAELARIGLRLERILDSDGTWILATP